MDGKSVFYETEDNQIVQHFLDMGIESRIIAEFEDLDELGNMDSDGRYLPFVVNQNLGYYNLAEDTVIMMDYYNTDSYQHSPSLSPDGKWLLFSQPTPGGNCDIWRLSLVEEEEPKLLTSNNW